MFGWGKKETDEEKAAKELANKLADDTPEDEQIDLYPPAGLNAFGEIPASVAADGGSFVDRKDRA